MKFALFYEIPVPRPWEEDSELIAYQNTLEQAIAGDKFGWHAFWTVEHHFLQEYSHCSNPEVLYGAIAAAHREHPARLRRAPHAQALQPPGAHGGVGGGARPALEGAGRHGRRPFGHPGRARGLRDRPRREPPDVAGGHRAHRGLLDQRGVRVRGRVLADAASSGAAQAVAEAAPAPLGRHHQRRGPRPGGRARTRPVLLRRRSAPDGGQAQDRRLPGRRRAVHAAHRRLREQPGGDVHHGPVRSRRREGQGGGPGVLRVVPQDGRPPDRHADGLDGRAQAGSGQLLLRRRHEEDATTRARSTS